MLSRQTRSVRVCVSTHNGFPHTQAGDHVVAVDDEQTRNRLFADVKSMFARGQAITMERPQARHSSDGGGDDDTLALPGNDEVARAIAAGEREAVVVRRFTSEQLGLVLAAAGSEAVVSRVVPDSAADCAGVLKNDRVVRIDGVRMRDPAHVTETLRMAGTTVVLTLIHVAPSDNDEATTRIASTRTLSPTDGSDGTTTDLAPGVGTPLQGGSEVLRRHGSSMKFDGDSIRFTPKQKSEGDGTGSSDDPDDDEEEHGDGVAVLEPPGLGALADGELGPGPHDLLAGAQQGSAPAEDRFAHAFSLTSEREWSTIKLKRRGSIVESTEAILRRMKQRPGLDRRGAEAADRDGGHKRAAAAASLKRSTVTPPLENTQQLADKAASVFSSTQSFRRALFQLDKFDTAPLEPTHTSSWMHFLGLADGTKGEADAKREGNDGYISHDADYPGTRASRILSRVSGSGRTSVDVGSRGRQRQGSMASVDGESSDAPLRGTRRKFRCIVEREEGTFGLTLVSTRFYPYPRVLALAEERYGGREATESSLRVGDRILEVNGIPTFGQPQVATEMLKECDRALFVYEHDPSPIQATQRRQSYRVRAAADLGALGRGASRIPVRTVRAGHLADEVLAEVNIAQRKLLAGGAESIAGDSFAERMMVEYVTLKRHLRRADWFFRVLADDAAHQEHLHCELTERERLVEQREAEVHRLIKMCDQLAQEKDKELEAQRAAYERELRYRHAELERKRRTHEAALLERAVSLGAELADKLHSIKATLPARDLMSSPAANDPDTDFIYSSPRHSRHQRDSRGSNYSSVYERSAASATARDSAGSVGAGEHHRSSANSSQAGVVGMCYDGDTTIVVGARVDVRGFCAGTVRFVGEIMGRRRIGVELDERKGINDGAAKGMRFFTCEPCHGVFVVPDDVTLRDDTSEPSSPASQRDDTNGLCGRVVNSPVDIDNGDATIDTTSERNVGGSNTVAGGVPPNVDENWAEDESDVSVSADQIIAAVAAAAADGVVYDGDGLLHHDTPDSDRADERSDASSVHDMQPDDDVNIDGWEDDDADLSSTRVIKPPNAPWSALDDGGDVRLGSSFRRRSMSKANPQRGFLTEL